MLIHRPPLCRVQSPPRPCQSDSPPVAPSLPLTIAEMNSYSSGRLLTRTRLGRLALVSSFVRRSDCGGTNWTRQEPRFFKKSNRFNLISKQYSFWRHYESQDRRATS